MGMAGIDCLLFYSCISHPITEQTNPHTPMYHLYNVVITIVFIIIIVFNTIIISFVFAYRAAAATRSIPQCFICVLSPDLFLSLSLFLYF